ncbi:O-antigen ligase family protein [Aquabacterium sp. A3]|uniref:O-antigen ligase family protein n=1 Tax=Aquabacterium sp. A3 TaxID=3132829 RepID=UPI003119A2C3
MNVWQENVPASRLAGLGAWIKKALPIVAVLFFASLMGAATGLGLGILIALLVVMVAVGALMLWDYRVGVVALILIMPVSNTYLFPRQLFGITGFSPENLILLGTAGVYFLKHLFSQDGPLKVSSKFFWFYVLPLLAAGFIGSTHVNNIFPGYLIDNQIKYSTPAPYLRDVVIKPLFFMLYAYLVAAAAKESRRPNLLLIPFVLSILVMVLVVFYGALSSGLGLAGLADSTNRQALNVVGMHANELGPMLVTGIVFVLFIQAGLRSVAVKAACWAVMGVAAVAVMLTFSRAAFLGLMIAAGFYFFGAKNGVRLLAGVLVISVIAMLLPQEVIDRISEGIKPGATDVQSMGKTDKLTAGRVAGIWIPVLYDIAQSPIVGRGMMSMLWSNASWTGLTPHLITHPHNAYLRLLMDMGLMGTLAVLTGVFLLWQKFRSLSTQDFAPTWLRAGARGGAMVLFVFAIFGITGSSWMPVPMQILAWGALGLILGAAQASVRDSRL